MTPSCYLLLHKLCQKLGLPEFPKIKYDVPDRPLSFAFDTNSIESDPLGGSLSLREFQLLHCGPYLDRQT